MNKEDELWFVCSEGHSEHMIGQNYDERRGTGNGPQICLKCKKTLQQLIAGHDTTLLDRIERDVIGRDEVHPQGMQTYTRDELVRNENRRRERIALSAIRKEVKP
jgi:hypothetical protein